MLKDVRTLDAEPEPGLLYLVPCVELRQIAFSRIGPVAYRQVEPGTFLPVLGTPHADPDLGAKERHQHADERFVDEADLPYLGYCQAHRFLTVINVEDTAGPVTLRPRPCRRRMPLHPSLRPKTRRLSLFFAMEYCARGFGCTGRIPLRGHGELEARFSGKRAVDGRCPHWGTPLHGQRIWTTADGRKIQVCPSHALCWEVGSGLFVPSPEIDLAGEDDPYGTLGELRARIAAVAAGVPQPDASGEHSP